MIDIYFYIYSKPDTSNNMADEKYPGGAPPPPYGAASQPYYPPPPQQGFVGAPTQPGYAPPPTGQQQGYGKLRSYVWVLLKSEKL